LEELMLHVRQELKEQSDLGEFGAAAIARELTQRGLSPLPSVRTIGRILARRGVLDARRRPRRRSPPLGWYLPAVAARAAEIDRVDVVAGLVIEGGPQVEVLTGIAVQGGLVAAWPMLAVTARATVDALVEHWHTWGLPAFAQFDNDTRFQGPHQYPDAVGRVIRLCLALDVVPVFAPPRETGFQAALEGCNLRHSGPPPDRKTRDPARFDQTPSRTRSVLAIWVIDVFNRPGEQQWLRRKKSDAAQFRSRTCRSPI
jgi:hypothetical protein